MFSIYIYIHMDRNTPQFIFDTLKLKDTYLIIN